MSDPIRQMKSSEEIVKVLEKFQEFLNQSEVSEEETEFICIGILNTISKNRYKHLFEVWNEALMGNHRLQ